jgi:arsenite methyltransferase
LCLLDDKATALREVHRVLRPGGRVAIGDVVAMHARLPVLLRGTLATLACVGSALEPGEHEALLQRAGFEVLSVEDHSPAAAAMARRITDRLRGARILGLEGAVPLEGGLAAAVEMARQAEAALGDGRLGYVLVLARRR